MCVNARSLHIYCPPCSTFRLLRPPFQVQGETCFNRYCRKAKEPTNRLRVASRSHLGSNNHFTNTASTYLPAHLCWRREFGYTSLNTGGPDLQEAPCPRTAEACLTMAFSKDRTRGRITMAMRLPTREMLPFRTYLAPLLHRGDRRQWVRKPLQRLLGDPRP